MLNFSRYRIISVGKVRKQWIKDGLSSYLKRLNALSIVELRDSNLQREADDIRSCLRQNELLVVLTEEGESLTSLELSKRLNKFGAQRLAFVIGGPNGLSPEIKELADWRFSLSSLTYPHELARLLFVEQLYRAQMILRGSPYHRA